MHRPRPTAVSRALGAFAAVVLLPAVAWACIWDTDTVRDELQQKATVYHVISGQVARHGAAYYRARLERSREELARVPDSLEGLYDLGAAHLRLGEHEEALAAFERAATIAPGRYKTHANLSAAYTEMGRYADAAREMEAALEENPAAHFGAGWLHLEMVRWRATLWETGRPAHCFLGTPYDERPDVRRAARDRARAIGLELSDDFDAVRLLTTLLRAQPDFADGYFVLGSTLHNGYDLNLALWAYVKALRIGHPRADAVQARIDQIFDHWKEAIRHNGRGRRLEPKATALAKIERALEEARAYVAAFKAHEARLVAEGPGLPDFEAVRASLDAAGIAPRPPVEAGMLGARDAPGSPARPAHRPEAQGGPRGPAQGAPPETEAKDAKDADARQARPVNAPPSSEGAPATASATPPWFVWFGLAMLGLSLGAVVIARARA